MAQNWNQFTSFWMNTATAPGTPLTGLSATINIRDLSGTLVVNAQAMIELGWGWYIYTFAGYDNTKDYVYDCNPGATAYRESGVTDRRLDHIDKNLSDIASSGGGGGFASGAIQTSIGNLGRNIDKKIEDAHTITREFIVKENNETNSHIELAKTGIIDTIDGIEQAEFKQEEKEAKKVLKLVTTLDKKLSSYIDSEMKEKDEIGALASEFTRMELEERKAEAEQAKKEKIQEEADKQKEKEQDKKELELIKSEFDKQDEQEKVEKKKEIEEELKEKEKEVAELEKELKKL